MHRPLGRAALVVYAPFSLAVARLHCIARWAARSFARLGRRACWLGRQHFMQGHDSAFRVWRILGGGKIRQTLCVLFLAKILMDPTFNSNSQRAKKILKIFIRYNQGANLHVELKAELVDEEMARLLSEANAYNIEIGIQSTNPKTLKAINRRFNKEKFIKGIRYLNKFKLYYEIQLIDALPHQTYDSLMKSFGLALLNAPGKSGDFSPGYASRNNITG